MRSPRFEPLRCPCGALWLKKRERVMEPKTLTGLIPLASLLKGGPGGTEQTG